MNLKEINEKLEEIRKRADWQDDEVAHRLRDELYIAVLKAIAKGAENPSELAEAALWAENIEMGLFYS